MNFTPNEMETKRERKGGAVENNKTTVAAQTPRRKEDEPFTPYWSIVQQHLSTAALVRLVTDYVGPPHPLDHLAYLKQSWPLFPRERRALGHTLNRTRRLALVMCQVFCTRVGQPQPMFSVPRRSSMWKARLLPCIGGCGDFWPLEDPAVSACWLAKDGGPTFAYLKREHGDRDLYCPECAEGEMDPWMLGMKLRKHPDRFVPGTGHAPRMRFYVPGLTEAFRRLWHEFPNELHACARDLFYAT